MTRPIPVAFVTIDGLRFTLRPLTLVEALAFGAAVDAGAVEAPNMVADSPGTGEFGVLVDTDRGTMRHPRMSDSDGMRGWPGRVEWSTDG